MYNLAYNLGNLGGKRKPGVGDSAGGSRDVPNEREKKMGGWGRQNDRLPRLIMRISGTVKGALGEGEHRRGTKTEGDGRNCVRRQHEKFSHVPKKNNRTKGSEKFWSQ